MRYEIISKDVALSGSILGDIIKLDGVFDYTIKSNLTDECFKVRATPNDLHHKFVMILAQYLVDAELIKGNIGVDYVCSNEEGDTFNIKDTDVSQWHDIINGCVPLKDEEKVCDEFIAHHTGENNMKNVYVGTAFTFNMVEDLTNINVDANPISWEEFDAVLFAMNKQHSEFIECMNGMGHESTAQMVHSHSYRRSLSLKSGDVLYIPQYRGPRLPEGATQLPKGAILVPIKVTIR